MGTKFKTPKGIYESYFTTGHRPKGEETSKNSIPPKVGTGINKAVKEAERIAKEIGGHIPERVLDDGLLNIKNENKPVIIIPLEEYKELIGNESFASGRIY